MTPEKIAEQIGAFIAAVERDDEATGKAIAIGLVANVLVDFNRIATALERLASPPAPAP